MQFHPQKCNVIHVTNKRKPITHSYKLHDHILEVMENSKYLGVTINNKLNWTQHITNIKGKASRTLGFLQRNLRGCKPNVKSTAYTTMVRPTLEYAGTDVLNITNQKLKLFYMYSTILLNQFCCMEVKFGVFLMKKKNKLKDSYFNKNL